MSLKIITDLIDKYCIKSLSELELFMEGEKVLIELKEPVIEDGKKYTADEITLKVDKIHFLNNKVNVFKNPDYKEYIINPEVKSLQNITFQKMNYNEFLEYENDFKYVLKEKLLELEKKIIKFIEDYIIENEKNIENIKFLITKLLLKKIVESNIILENGFDDDDDYIIYNLNGSYTHKNLTSAMKLVFKRQEKFKEKIKEDFGIYYVKSDFEIYLENLKPELSSKSKKKLEKNCFPNIFPNDLGYTLFNSYQKIYEENKTIYQANYSFLYYALDKDNLIIRNQKKFIEFLSHTFDIHLTKIDSKKKNNPEKLMEYNLIKTLISS